MNTEYTDGSPEKARHKGTKSTKENKVAVPELRSLTCDVPSFVSIIIPAFNAQDTIASCVEAVLAQAVPPERYEIIVIDDGSDIPIQFANGRLRVIRQKRGGASAARNSGLKAAHGEVVIFLDADCIPARGWLVAMLAPFADPSVMGVSGRVDTLQPGLLPRFIQYEYDLRFQRLATSQDIDFITSATGAYRRQALIEAGGYCEELGGAEDVELSFRLAEQGYRLRYAADAVVYHTHPTSLLRYAWRKRHYALWRMAVYLRYKNKLIADSRTPQTQKLQILVLGIAGLAVLGAWYWPALWAVAAVGAVLYAFLIAPTVLMMLRRNRRVGLLSPIFLTASTVGGAVGILQAFISSLLSRIWAKGRKR